mgnify:CR=1 FL=1
MDRSHGHECVLAESEILKKVAAGKIAEMHEFLCIFGMRFLYVFCLFRC